MPYSYTIKLTPENEEQIDDLYREFCEARKRLKTALEQIALYPRVISHEDEKSSYRKSLGED